MGILTGCGLQKVSMIMMFIGYYLVSFPIGVMLAFRKELGVFGNVIILVATVNIVVTNRVMGWCCDWLICTGND